MKKVQVIWLNQALNNLDTIYDFLAEQSPPAAQRVTENILRRTRQLETFPESGAAQETLTAGADAYRYLVEGNYKVIYSYQTEIHTAYIVTIFDTRYNPEKLTV